MDLYESLLKENGLILMMLTTTKFLTFGLIFVVANKVMLPSPDAIFPRMLCGL